MCTQHGRYGRFPRSFHTSGGPIFCHSGVFHHTYRVCTLCTADMRSVRTPTGCNIPIQLAAMGIIPLLCCVQHCAHARCIAAGTQYCGTADARHVGGCACATSIEGISGYPTISYTLPVCYTLPTALHAADTTPRRVHNTLLRTRNGIITLPWHVQHTRTLLCCCTLYTTGCTIPYYAPVVGIIPSRGMYSTTYTLRTV